MTLTLVQFKNCQITFCQITDCHSNFSPIWKLPNNWLPIYCLPNCQLHCQITDCHFTVLPLKRYTIKNNVILYLQNIFLKFAFFQNQILSWLNVSNCITKRKPLKRIFLEARSLCLRKVHRERNSNTVRSNNYRCEEKF